MISTPRAPLSQGKTEHDSSMFIFYLPNFFHLYRRCLLTREDTDQHPPRKLLLHLGPIQTSAKGFLGLTCLPYRNVTLLWKNVGNNEEDSPGETLTHPLSEYSHLFCFKARPTLTIAVEYHSIRDFCETSHFPGIYQCNNTIPRKCHWFWIVKNKGSCFPSCWLPFLCKTEDGMFVFSTTTRNSWPWSSNFTVTAVINNDTAQDSHFTQEGLNFPLMITWLALYLNGIKWLEPIHGCCCYVLW